MHSPESWAPQAWPPLHTNVTHTVQALLDPAWLQSSVVHCLLLNASSNTTKCRTTQNVCCSVRSMQYCIVGYTDSRGPQPELLSLPWIKYMMHTPELCKSCLSDHVLGIHMLWVTAQVVRLMNNQTQTSTVSFPLAKRPISTFLKLCFTLLIDMIKLQQECDLSFCWNEIKLQEVFTETKWIDCFWQSAHKKASNPWSKACKIFRSFK